jgi:putative FmdB family regulatory protein
VPIYEYGCDSCGHRFEVRQSFKDTPIAVCERCSQPVRKLISSPAIMFKGSGWYVTDYSDKLKEPKKSDASPNGKETTSTPAKDAAPAAAASSTPSSGGDSKPAASTSTSTSNASTTTPKSSS